MIEQIMRLLILALTLGACSTRQPMPEWGTDAVDCGTMADTAEIHGYEYLVQSEQADMHSWYAFEPNVHDLETMHWINQCLVDVGNAMGKKPEMIRMLSPKDAKKLYEEFKFKKEIKK